MNTKKRAVRTLHTGKLCVAYHTNIYVRAITMAKLPAICTPINVAKNQQQRRRRRWHRARRESARYTPYTRTLVMFFCNMCNMKSWCAPAMAFEMHIAEQIVAYTDISLAPIKFAKCVPFAQRPMTMTTTTVLLSRFFNSQNLRPLFSRSASTQTWTLNTNKQRTTNNNNTRHLT